MQAPDSSQPGFSATTTYQDELLHGNSTKAQHLAQVEDVPCTVADLSSSWRYAPGCADELSK